MYIDYRMQCRCGNSFVITGDEQQLARDGRHRLSNLCQRCRGNEVVVATHLSAAVSTRLPESLERQLTDHLLGKSESLVSDLRGLLTTAFAPAEAHRQTWLEWLSGVDLYTKHLEQKCADSEQVRKVVVYRTALVQDLRKMILESGELQSAELAAELSLIQKGIARQKLGVEQLKLEQERLAIQGQLEVQHLRVEAERLELQEQIAQCKALADGRLKTGQLEEARKQIRLLEQIQPPPKAEVIDVVAVAIEDQLREVKAKATARLRLIAECVTALSEVFAEDIDDSVKATKIRAVMEAYKQEPEAVPLEIREFLDRVDATS